MNFYKLGFLTLFFFVPTLRCMEERPQNQSLKKKQTEEEQKVTLKRAKILEQNPRALWHFLGRKEQFLSAIKKILNHPSFRPDSIDFTCACGLIAINCNIDNVPCDENFKGYITKLKYQINSNFLYDITLKLLSSLNRTAEENELLKSSIQLLPDYNLMLKCGHTLLIMAINYGNTEITKLLIELGANPNFQNKHNETPLLYAVYTNNVDLVAFLLEHGADIMINGKSILSLAYSKGNQHMIKLIQNALSIKAG